MHKMNFIKVYIGQWKSSKMSTTNERYERNDNCLVKVEAYIYMYITVYSSIKVIDEEEYNY